MVNSLSPHVVLLSDDREAVGTALKAAVHGVDTPLHQAFSVYLFDTIGRLLMTRRSLSKTAWPGVWTNSFCGHPEPGEDLFLAIRRRAMEELGVQLESSREVLPDFVYRATDPSGLVENEVCPVFFAVTSQPVRSNPDEVMEHSWVFMPQLVTAVRAAPWAFSPWLVLQLDALRQAGELLPAAGDSSCQEALP